MPHFQEWVLETGCTLEQRMLWYWNISEGPRLHYAFLNLRLWLREVRPGGEHLLSQDLLDLESEKTRAMFQWDIHSVRGVHPRRSQLASRTRNLFSCFVRLEREITTGNISKYYRSAIIQPWKEVMERKSWVRKAWASKVEPQRKFKILQSAFGKAWVLVDLF